MGKKSQRARRRKERRARQNLELQKRKAMIDAPKTPKEDHEPQIEKSGTPPVDIASNSYTPASTDNAQAQNATTQKHYSQYVVGPLIAIFRLFRGFFRFFDEHHGGVTAVATIVISVLTFFYVRYSKHQWETMRETMKIDQRAWVGIPSTETVGGVENTQPWRVGISFKSLHVVIRNTGKTPALKLRGECCAVLKVGFKEPIPDYASAVNMFPEYRNFTMMFPSGDVLPPTGEQTIKVLPDGSGFGGPYKPGEYTPLLYVLGQFTYDDVFHEKRHHTTFCLVKSGAQFALCREGNWMD
jgi:hypothetical protein